LTSCREVVNLMSKQSGTVKLTGTAILAALVIVFDYTLKYSGLKIPFPWYPNLKFDFTGIPIALSLFLYGFPPSVMTSLVAGVGIVARSGNVISASMKVAAELSTVVGLHFGQKLGGSSSKYLSWAAGLLSRVLVMTVVNLYVLPNFYGVPLEATIGLLPLIGAFNVIQGAITVGLGYYLFEAVKSRLPQWAP
jgi:riboflavin transporter FmnP